MDEQSDMNVPTVVGEEELRIVSHPFTLCPRRHTIHPLKQSQISRHIGCPYKTLPLA